MAKKLDPNDSPLNDNETITPRQESIASMLATGKSISAIVRETGIAQATVWRWKQLPAFNQRVEHLRRQLIDGAIGRLSDLMAGKALDVLIARLDKVDDETGQTAATLEDVKAAFDLYGGLRSNQELAEKLDRLAEKLGGNGDAE